MNVGTDHSQDDTDRCDAGRETVPPQSLAPVFDLIRRELDQLDAVRLTVTWQTGTGNMTVDLQRDDWLRVTLTGDAPARTFVLDPEWGAAT